MPESRYTDTKGWPERKVYAGGWGSRPDTTPEGRDRTSIAPDRYSGNPKHNNPTGTGQSWMSPVSHLHDGGRGGVGRDPEAGARHLENPNHTDGATSFSFGKAHDRKVVVDVEDAPLRDNRAAYLAELDAATRAREAAQEK